MNKPASPARFVRPIPPELLRQIMRDDLNDNGMLDRRVPRDPMLPGWACALGAAILCPFLAAFLSWLGQ